MPDPAPIGIPAKPAKGHPAKGAFKVLYDGQCEICQACVSWLKTLDDGTQTICLPLSEEVLSSLDSRLRMDACLRQLHVVTPEGEILIGWDAVARLARLFPATWLIGALGQRSPFRNMGRSLYGFVATNRYSLSKCRGGAYRISKPEVVQRQARLGAFWSCYTLGFFIRLPLVIWSGISAAAQRISTFARTYHKRLDLLDGKLTILFLNGMLPNTVPLLFGEQFTTVLYDGVAIDPGSPKMRRSLARHLRKLKTKITKIVATHAHEEHVGNPELALWPQRCCDLCFRYERKISYSIQKASVGTRRRYRPASGSETAIRTVRRVPRHCVRPIASDIRSRTLRRSHRSL